MSFIAEGFTTTFTPEETSIYRVLPCGSLETNRLYLRTWNEEDINEIQEIMSDCEVSYFLQHHKLNQLSTIQSMAAKAKTTISEHGYGYFICESKATKEVIGLVGLNYVEIKADHFPCYTVSWILKKSCWGRGFAKEAALGLLEYGFHTLKLEKIYACTTWNNEQSLRVMKSVKMEFVHQFDFPGIEKNDLFCQHHLYVKEKS